MAGEPTGHRGTALGVRVSGVASVPPRGKCAEHHHRHEDGQGTDQYYLRVKVEARVGFGNRRWADGGQDRKNCRQHHAAQHPGAGRWQ